MSKKEIRIQTVSPTQHEVFMNIADHEGLTLQSWALNKLTQAAHTYPDFVRKGDFGEHKKTA